MRVSEYPSFKGLKEQGHAEDIEETWHSLAARLLKPSARLAVHPTGGARCALGGGWNPRLRRVPAAAGQNS
jgi:hypothetical protein